MRMRVRSKMAASSGGAATPHRPQPPSIPAVYRTLPSTIQQTCTQELDIKVKQSFQQTKRNSDFSLYQRLGTASSEEYVSSFLRSRLAQKRKGVVDQMKVQMMWLEGPGKGGRDVSRMNQPRKRLSSRKKRELGLYQIPKDKQRFLYAKK